MQKRQFLVTLVPEHFSWIKFGMYAKVKLTLYKIKIHIIYTIYFPRALLYRQTNIHEKLFVFQGNCLELGAYGVLNQVKCENFTGGSPVSPYLCL